MITTKEQLKRCLALEKKLYTDIGLKRHLTQIIVSDSRLIIYRYLKALRKEEFHHNNRGVSHSVLYLLHRRRRTRLGLKLGLDMWEGIFDEGLLIYHAGNIVVNGKSRIGKNCKLHGSNCIGNDGKSSECPVLGDNVRLGVGAKIIGNVKIADNITVAAGAVVVHSFDEPGIMLAGIPARKIH